MQITINTDADFTPAGKRAARVVTLARGAGRIRWYVSGRIYRQLAVTAENTTLTSRWLAGTKLAWSAPVVTEHASEPQRAEAETFDAAAVRIVRHRQSVTQGEASVFYGDTLIARFGDKIALRDGLYDGYPDGVWIEAAQRWHRGELRGL